MSRTLVLGIGNVLLQDDGVGVRAVERLAQRYRLPAEVAVLDGGAKGLALLAYLENVQRLIIVDAVRAGRTPGTLIRLEREEIPALFGPVISAHEEGLVDLLWAAMATDRLPKELILLGIEPLALDTGLTLSEPVAAQVDTLVECMVDELRRWGYKIEPSTTQE